MNSDEGTIRNNLIKIGFALGLVILGGTIGYSLLEGWGIFDSFFMLIITITTTGYGEVHPLSSAGRWLSIGLMFTGVGILFYGLNIIIPAMVESRIERWKRVLKKMSNHYIICGYGDMGSEVAQEMATSFDKSNIVIVDSRMDKVARARENGFVAIQGNPSEEDTLEEAHIEKAKGLIACMQDSENAFTIMLAKEINNEIFTVAVARTLSGKKNIGRAGADQILAPYSDTAKKARVLLKNPVAAEFSEIVSEITDVGMLQKISLINSNILGKTLKEIDLRKRTGALVMAIEREGKVIRPHPEVVFQLNDDLYMVGEEDQLSRASQILKGNDE